jgi:hypothetical protein
MANVPTPEFQKLRPNLIESGDTIQQHPNAEVLMECVGRVPIAIACFAKCTIASVGESLKWTLIILNMVDTRRILHQCPVWSVHRGATRLDVSPQRECCQRGDSQDHNYCTSIQWGILWAEKTKAKPSDDADKRTNKPTASARGVKDPQLQSKDEVPKRNFFAPLPPEVKWNGDDAKDLTKQQQHQAPSRQAGTPPSVVLTSQVNLIQFQEQLQGLLKGNFKFHSTRTGTRIATKQMVDFSTICSHFERSNVPCFTFYPKSQKPIKAVI